MVKTATAQTITFDLTAEQVAMCKRAGINIEESTDSTFNDILRMARASDPVSIELDTLAEYDITLDAALKAKLQARHGIDNKRQYIE